MAKKTTTKKTAKKAATKKSAAKSAAKKVSKKTGGRKGPKPGSKRITYAASLKKKVVAAVKKGMTHLEASKAFKVGVHSIGGWVKKSTRSTT